MMHESEMRRKVRCHMGLWECLGDVLTLGFPAEGGARSLPPYCTGRTGFQCGCRDDLPGIQILLIVDGIPPGWRGSRRPSESLDRAALWPGVPRARRLLLPLRAFPFFRRAGP